MARVTSEFPCHLSPERFLAYLEDLGRRKAHEVYGFFGPRSILWKLSRESILHMGGLRALLLQLSHPVVAQGVYDHSNFLHDPIGRAYRTFRAVYGIVYGSRKEAIQFAYRTFLIHEKVQGVIADPASPLYGKPYRANDPDPLYWVHATLVEATLFTYELFVAPLKEGEKEQFFEEARLFLMLFGVPADFGPRNLEEFFAYFRERIDSPLHRFTREGRELARAILDGPHILRHFPILRPANSLIAIGTLPPAMREDLQIPAPPSLVKGFEVFAGALRQIYPRIPERLRVIPQYRRALRRCQRFSESLLPSRMCA